MGTIYHVGADGRGYADAYAEPLAERELPRYRVPQEKSDPQAVRNLIRDELYLDGNAAQNVATFCTTYDDDDVRYLMDMSVNKNLIDKDYFPPSSISPGVLTDSATPYTCPWKVVAQYHDISVGGFHPSRRGVELPRPVPDVLRPRRPGLQRLCRLRQAAGHGGRVRSDSGQ